VDSRRAESFSDGTFAVAITVLVFNLLPIGERHLSYSVLRLAWPQYTAYVISFLTIGIMWMNHHTMLSLVSQVDRTLLGLNLFLLMGVVALPFPTAMVATNLNGPASQGRVATVAYGLTMIAISLGYASCWVYIATHQQKLSARRVVVTPRASTLRFTGGLSAYVLGTLIAAVWSAGIALAIFGLTGVYYLFEHLPDPAGGDQDAAGADPDEASQTAL
jgi:uncharacterized membrane protein